MAETTGGDEQTAVASGLQRLLGAETVTLLSNRNFRHLYAGRAVSRVGDELYTVAAMWLVYALTGSTLYTGLAGFLSRAPQAVGFLLGPFVDRADLRRLVVAAELGQAAVVLVVPIAAALDLLNVWIVLGIMPMLALLARLSGPAQNAALPRLVDDGRLVRANSIDSVTMRSVDALAGAAAGGLVALVGAVAVYGLNVVTFLASALLFAMLAIPATEATGTTPDAGEYVRELRDGFALVRESAVGHMVVAASLAGAFTGAATAVLPAFGASIGGPTAYGLLVASMTGGTLVGSLAATRFEARPFGRVTIAGFLLAAGGWIGAVASNSAGATYLLFGLATVPIGVYNVLVSTLLQLGVPDDQLGRVSATIGSLLGIVGPLGVLAGGWLGDLFGAGRIIAASGVGYAVVASYWTAIPTLRRFPAIESIESGQFGT